MGIALSQSSVLLMRVVVKHDDRATDYTTSCLSVKIDPSRLLPGNGNGDSLIYHTHTRAHGIEE